MTLTPQERTELTGSDEDIVEAFQLFLRSVGPYEGENTTFKDTEAMLAALDVLDPALAERISQKIENAND